jgi:glycosyl transferase/beta-hydroxylase protein BlmF
VAVTDRPRARDLADLWRLLLGHLPSRRDATLQDVATRALRDGPGRAWIVSAVNASLRARQALAFALRLEPRRLFSRAAFALGRTRVDRGAPAVRLSLLCPTRGRPGHLATFVRSLARTAAKPGRLDALFYVDDDDPALPAYEGALERLRETHPALGRCELMVGPPVGVPGAWNALAERARGELLLMANDDQVYVDYGWDLRLDGALADLRIASPDGVACLYFDAGQYPDGAADFPILTRSWYEAMGYFTPSIFEQWEVETWLFDIAHRVDRLLPVPGVLVEHRHYQDYKAPFDATYQRHRMTRATSFADHALFVRTERDREAEAARLRRRIAGTPTAVIDPSELWFTSYLEESYPRIRAELDAAGTWSEAQLYDTGVRNDAVCARFPVTAEIVGAIPEVTTFGPGGVTMSRLAPGTHRSPTSATLRVHLGLRVPPDASIRVGEETLECQEGRCFVFDDAFEHEVRHQGTEEWIVLNLDVLNPLRERI